MKITEMDLMRLGFEKIVVSPEESGDTTGYYYYEYELSNSNTDFCLISIESEKVVDDAWKVQLFEVADYEFSDRFKLREFINLLLNIKKKQNYDTNTICHISNHACILCIHLPGISGYCGIHKTAN